MFGNSLTNLVNNIVNVIYLLHKLYETATNHPIIYEIWPL